MPQIGDLTILVPVDISEPEPPDLAVLDLLRPFEVVLLGYFLVPDQAEPAHIRAEYQAEAETRLAEVAARLHDTREVLVFTHDRETTIDRVADQYDCDAVLVAGDATAIERILVPIRGEVNLERIVSVVAGLLQGTSTTATFFHSIPPDAEPSVGEFMLRGTVDRLTEYGIDPDRVDWQLSEGGDPHSDIAKTSADYDLVVVGETEPSLRERIIGDILSMIIDSVDRPTLIVRDVE